LGACSRKLYFDKLARPAAYGAVDGDSPEAGLALGLLDLEDWAVCNGTQCHGMCFRIGQGKQECEV